MNIFNTRNLLKNADIKKSKQYIMSKKMFGSRRGRHGKDLQIGKKFRGHGKSTSVDISPSVEAFDHMMSKISGKGELKKKRTLFNKD